MRKTSECLRSSARSSASSPRRAARRSRGASTCRSCAQPRPSRLAVGRRHLPQVARAASREHGLASCGPTSRRARRPRARTRVEASTSARPRAGRCATAPRRRRQGRPWTRRPFGERSRRCALDCDRRSRCGAPAGPASRPGCRRRGACDLGDGRGRGPALVQPVGRDRRVDDDLDGARCAPSWRCATSARRRCG